MACDCGSHASNWLCSLQNMTANILTGLEEGGVLPYAFNTVELLYLTNVNARPFAGDPGQKIQTKVKITPTPIVETNIEIYNSEEGVKGYYGGSIVERTGLAKIRNIVASDATSPTTGYNQKQLETANFWLINGQQYDLVDGSLKRLPNGIFWEAIVIKSKGNGL